jgi:CDP-6-deoxy-D-xylo-4-hexulose-3-dehydrase
MSKNQILGLVEDYVSHQLNQKDFIPGKSKVPASGAVLSPRDATNLTEAVLSLWYTDGKFCGKFRRELSKQNSEKHVTLTNSGSSANLLAMCGAVESFPHATYVITCATNFPTSVAPIYQTGHIPIYIDIDPETLSPDLNQFQMALDKYKGKIAGTIFPHILGFPFDEWVFFGGSNEGFVIIDCCDALGAEMVHKDETDYFPVGTYSDISTLSFFPAHHITTAEGGAVITGIGNISKVMDSFANWGRDCWCAPGQDNTCGHRFEHEWDHLPIGYDHKYTFSRLGYNLKMTEWQAALGVSQLDRLSAFVETRRNNYKYLLDNLLIFQDHIRFISVPEWSRPSPFGFPIYADGFAQDLIAFLEERNIATRRVFAGNITRQPGFHGLPNIAFGLSNSDDVMENCFWIGCHPGLTKEMLDYVVEAFDGYFRGK